MGSVISGNPLRNSPAPEYSLATYSAMAFMVLLNISALFLPTPVAYDRIPSTTPGAEPPRDARDSGSARSHSTHLETSSSDRP